MTSKSRQLKAAEELLHRTLAWGAELAPVTGQFPISSADAKPAADLRKAAYQVLTVQVGLLEIRGFLRETELNEPVSEAIRLTLISSRRLLSLAESMTAEDQASKKQMRAWTWSEVEKAFSSHVRPAMSKMSRCEWHELIEGKYMYDLDRQMIALIQVALRVLLKSRTPVEPESRTPAEPAGEMHRRGSAHEEHVRDGRSWCAICGWIDEIEVQTDVHTLYHGFLSSRS